MLQGTHHHPHKKPITVIDHLMYLIAFLSPVLTVPQFLDIWANKNASGLSALTWGGYTVASFFWLFYWREHNEKWILISQIVIFLLNAGVFVGILMFT